MELLIADLLGLYELTYVLATALVFVGCGLGVSTLVAFNKIAELQAKVEKIKLSSE